MGSGVWVKNSWDWKGNSSVQDEILNFGGRFCNLTIWTFQVWEKSPLEQWCKTSLRKKQKEIEAKCFHASKKLQCLKSKLSLLQSLDIQNRSSGPVIIVIGKFHFPHQHTSKYFYKYRLKIG